MSNTAAPEIQGTNDPRFDPVREYFTKSFADGLEVGASAVVTLDGEVVLDLWGGVADAESGAMWERDTIVNVWSTTKTMAGICMLMLADRGELDFDAPVATYWPEFAAEGKEAVLVRHVMGHTSGLSGWQTPIVAEDLYDWEKATGLLAAQAPLWTPGEGSGYHAITLGNLQGEVLRRITGQTIGEFFAHEVAGPLGADFHIGTGAEHDDRIATLVPPGGNIGDDITDEASIAYRTLASCPLDATEPRDERWRRAEIPAAGGHGNARSVAAVHAAIACGGSLGDVTLCAPESLERVFDVQADGIDHVLGKHLTFGMGFGLPNEDVPLSPNKRAFYWGGWGGSVAVIDLDARLSVSYVMNRMEKDSDNDYRGPGLVLTAYGCLA